MSNRMQRRAFLQGAGSVMVGLPFLSMLQPRRAFGQAVAKPKRLVVVFSSQGFVRPQFNPSSSTGTLPTTLPTILAPLAAYRDRMTVITGPDNVISRLCSASNGHNANARSAITAQPFTNRGSSDGPAAGPSFDWVMGPLLRGGATRAVVNFAVGEGFGENTVFWTASGNAATPYNDPRAALSALFSTAPAAGGAARAPMTPGERLVSRRASVLDAVRSSYKRLLVNAPAEDRARLEQHAAQIRALEVASGGTPTDPIPTDPGTNPGTDPGTDPGTPPGPAQPTQQCAKPTHGLVASDGYADENMGDKMANAHIENIVMTLACDVSRVATLQFCEYHDPRFRWEFGNSATGAVQGDSRSYTDWHEQVHLARGANDSRGTANLTQGFTWYGKKIARLCDRLSQMDDGDGQSILDNTTILWVTEFGNGAGHDPWDIPYVVVNGQQSNPLRKAMHVRATGRTTGDVFTSLRYAIHGSNELFGLTGEGYGTACHSNNGIIDALFA
jgi:Protein of unknown function (DUF1552)